MDIGKLHTTFPVGKRTWILTSSGALISGEITEFAGGLVRFDEAVVIIAGRESFAGQLSVDKNAVQAIWRDRDF